MTITIVIINPRQEMGWSVDDVMPRRDGLRIWKILKKIQLSSDHGVEKWGPTIMLRSWGPTIMLRSWGPTIMLRN